MTYPAFGVMPTSVVQAYQTADALQNTDATPTTGATSFGGMLSRAVDDAIATGHDADAKSVAAIEGHGNITDVVTAVSKAEIALQTSSTIRDRMVQAYQDIMKMPI